MKHTAATKAKLSAMRIGERNPFFGRKHSPETRAKLAASTRRYNAVRQYVPQQQRVRIPSDLGYFAGIVDGEGSIRFAAGRPFVAVYNTDERLMKWLVANVGGSYRAADRRGRTVCYDWRIGAANDVYAVCIALAPRLLIKRADAEKVIRHLRERYG